MANLGKSAGLSDAEFADLKHRVDLFNSAWKADGSAAPETFLPPPGTRHRTATVVELFKIDMERRAREGLPVRAETYLPRLPIDAAPLVLIVAEYRLRHRHGDRPGLDEFRTRFPAFADKLRAELVAPSFEMSLAEEPPAGTAHLADAAVTVATPVPPPQADATPTEKATPATDRPPVPVPSADDILPADVGYRLLKKIGQGAYGEVFEALAPGGFRVAVKRILRSADHPASQGEVESLEAMKAMSHPFLVQTHAYWVFRDRLVIVMELADASLAGETARHKANGLMGVPPEELVPIFEQAGEALDYLHSRRVTHRDVKPENLLLLKGYAKVADFGLAREHRNDETKVATEVGTPLYMAPEVWKRAVNLHSDQYSLAATYVSARLGRPIFPGATTLYDLMFQHVNDTPNLDPLDPAEQAVLLKAMAKKPEHRYPSCAAFARALNDAIFPPPPPPTPVVVRRRTALWFGLVLGCGAAGALVAKYSRPEPPPVPPPPPPPVPPPPPPWCPKDWSPKPDAGTTTVPDGRTLHTRLVRTVGGEQLEAILIPPKAGRRSDPAPFYMLRNKVTNRAFKAAWDEADKDTDSRVNWFRRLLNTPDAVQLHFPGRWRFTSLTVDTPRQDFDGTPVMGVTGVEAMLIAEGWGGHLPTYAQWLKAVGANGDDSRPSPAGAEEQPGEVLSARPLALGVQNPWDVTRETVDMSVFGIHQLISNGEEWTDGENEAERTNWQALPSAGHPRRVTGMLYSSRKVSTFSRIHTIIRNPMIDWISDEAWLGFRIVLTPP